MGGYGAPPAPAAFGGLPPNWSEQKDDQQRTYYFNSATGQSVWERPSH